jgi:hypothetical protein
MGEGHITRLIATVDHNSNGRKTSSVHCYCEYEAFTSLQILESEASWVIFKKNHHSKNMKRLTIKDKSMPTPIDLNRVGKLLSSTVHSCCLGTVRIFNIISLHFGE